MLDFLLSCDWGSSSFRLRLVNAQRRIVDEVLSNKGVAHLYRAWTKDRGGEKTGIEALYYKELLQGIEKLEGRSSLDLKGIPVVISGMACSVMGIRELPYAPLPFSLNGRDAIVEAITSSEDFPHKIFLISGVSGDGDVMRGEETQIIGLASGDKTLFGDERTLCIFPGTHSKHIHLHKGAMYGFQTFMTGELFGVMMHHSMLKDAVSDIAYLTAMNNLSREAFCQGVEDAKSHNVLHALFKVRVNQLLRFREKKENTYYLSGLLIGTELASIKAEETEKIILCSGSKLYELYKQAIQQIKEPDNVRAVDAETMDHVVVSGHIAILLNLLGW